MLRAGLSALAAIALAACASDEPQGSDPPSLDGATYLSPTDHLVRVAMALTGTRPNREELRAVRASPHALGGIVEGYLESDGFGRALRDLHNESLNVRVAAAIYPAGFPALGALADRDVQAINVSVTEAPLRLVEHVVRGDRPYTEIVTADYTVANDVVAEVWGLDRDESGKRWTTARYRDGREHAGVLSDSMFFTRHSTTFSNRNRGRANAVSRALLCYDFITRDIEVDATIDLANPEEVANAVQKNTACAGCHQTLDPLASYFGAFSPTYVPSDIDGYPVEFHLPGLAQVFTTTSPGYYGYQGGGLRHLGQAIADDPRFAMCAARRFYAYFHQVPLQDVPLARVSRLRDVLTSRWSAKDLARAIVLDDDFRVSHVDEAHPENDRLTLLKARPWQIAETFADVAGFRWEAWVDADLGTGRVGAIDLMTDSLFGYEVLWGGIDSVQVTLPAHTMTASSSLVLRGLASLASDQVVDGDFTYPRSAKLLRLAASGDTSEAAIRAQLVELFLDLYGQFATESSQEITAAWELFEQSLGEAGGDARRAWKTTLFALLQDPRLVHY